MAAILIFWPNCVDICSQCKVAGTIKKKSVQLCELFFLNELSEEKKKDNGGDLKMYDEPK